jgi:hypothetical protein
LTLAAALAAFGAEAAEAQPAPPAAGAPEPPNALTTLLPHQKGRALCYVSRGTPVTFPLEDIPERKPQRRLTVRRFLFELRSDKFEADDTTTPPTPGKAYYGYRLVAEVQGRMQRLVAAGECDSGNLKDFGCGVECDGGVMHFEPLQGSDSLQMRVADEVNRFRMTRGCDDEDSYEVLTYDPATPAVRLDRADAKACRPIARAFKRPK